MLRLVARAASNSTVYTYTRWIRSTRFITVLTSHPSPPPGHKPPTESVKETLTPNCWTSAEHHKARILLRRGATIPEIAGLLEESEVAVRWSLSLKSDEYPVSNAGTVRKLKFSKEEDDYMLELWKLGLQRPVIGKYLGRSCASIKSVRLARLAQKLASDDKLSMHQGPQELPREIVELVFEARLRELWHGLLQSDMTDTWRANLSQESAESWLSDIAKNTPAKVKRLLASHEPPIVAKLLALPWTSTDKAGVYGWLLTPRTDVYLNSHCYLYVGSGSKVGHGLEGRRQDHLSGRRTMHNPRLLRLIHDQELERDGYFFTLLSVETDAIRQAENVGRMRCLVTLAEAIFSMWLGAFGERGLMYERNFSHLYPWGVREVPYNGCSSHNPLSMDISPPTASQCTSDKPLSIPLPKKSVFRFRYKKPSARKKRHRWRRMS